MILRRLLLVVVAALAVYAALPASAFWQSRSQVAISGGGAVYAGPGDVFPGALAGYGSRAYSAADAAGVTKPAYDVVDGSGANTTTINILSTGALDAAAVATFIGAHGTPHIAKAYDVVGGVFHLTQATVSKMPTLVTGIGSYPYVMNFVAASSQFLESSFSGPWVNQPVTVSFVAKRPTPGSSNSVVGDDAGVRFGFNSSANQATIYGGTTQTATASDSLWHAIQGVLNGASSDINVDGTSVPTAINPGTLNPSFRFILGGDNGGPVDNHDGTVAEAWLYGSAFSSGTSSSMSTNQHSYGAF